ncbi:hydroxyacylglutathione hydrolase [Legionella lansingensis]|uniref:Hydroxyacylglutathione hydrolase n=1 Tax=Legionella lansingensis TaxID=45067 RepID=A0A0W0VT49_9GAMM|nr:hydroxyacylglutathione hydrolase [Legionella lansingensis]KTD23412.1 hydroxyacylglutathione hydrolase (glyoxalase II) [Legionella lansingensis]SNV49588.1 hydroxyacylglutathione hydrolase [Legionella lansingensis]
MSILPIPAFNDNYIWLITDETGNKAFCVDPGDARPVIDFVTQNSIELTTILLTHHHYDHIGGVPELIRFNPNIVVYGPLDPRISHITHPLTENTTLSIATCNFEVLNTPGHTSTHISLYEPSLGWLFCGDTLFSAGCGRVFDGTIAELHHSLQVLKALPADTNVFCAHEYTRQNLRFATLVEPDNLKIQNYAKELAKHNQCSLPSTMGLEREINPFLRTEEEDVIKYASLKGNKNLDSLSVFKQIRADKDTFS